MSILKSMAIVMAAAVVVTATALVGGCGSSGDAQAPASPSTGTPASTPTKGTPATRAEVQAFVEKAVAFARAEGADRALAVFTAPGGEFHQGELYIYAYDFDGTVLAHGGDPSLVGQNLIDMHDPDGLPVIQELARLAGDGGGWLSYKWANPEDDGRVEQKLGYVMKVDDEWFLGSGTYGPSAAASE